MGEPLKKVSKSEFARICNVSPGRVSQYFSEGKLDKDCLDGEGRCAKIIVEIAQAQLRDRLDISQRIGLNGISTDLGAEPAAVPVSLAAPDNPSSPEAPTLDQQLKLEKLHDSRFRRRKREEEERERRGIYVRTADVRVQMTKVAEHTVRLIEGGMAGLATALAAKFELPQRDVLHELRLEMRKVRASAATNAKRAADDLPHEVEDDYEDAEAAAA